MSSHSPVKIAICGTHGTGKSTTVRALADAFNTMKVEIVPEFARTYAAHAGNPDILMQGKDSPVSQLLSLIHYPVIEAMALARRPDLVICDRGILDSFAYVTEVGVPFSRSEREYAQRLLNDHAKTYDLVFYHPIEFALSHDGVRNSEHHFQRHMDKAIREQWARANVGLIEVRGSLEARVQTIMQYLPHL